MYDVRPLNTTVCTVVGATAIAAAQSVKASFSQPTELANPKVVGSIHDAGGDPNPNINGGRSEGGSKVFILLLSFFGGPLIL